MAIADPISPQALVQMKTVVYFDYPPVVASIPPHQSINS
jgi:hypothetical protein